ncbi:hypothetical protein ACIG3E_25015 [Streptomyces sp. NPDC053474]|uniref:hypothetical protein n=1 Tax=Streptomyces sp. NPDC053474 TaxID=3365704 RepID=UPI0037D6AB49
MIKRAVVGTAAAALVAIGGGVSLAHAGTDSSMATTSTANAVPATPHTHQATTSAWSWVNGEAHPDFEGGPHATPHYPTNVTAAGWLDKHHEYVL